ncbi:MAG: hypothetical protein U5L72_02435 [Bacteroidales bacterium]|nr:hypothetical protein [Bacteroidales bacterium]
MTGIINVVSRKGDLSLLEFDGSVFRQEYDMLLDSYRSDSAGLFDRYPENESSS